jgi:hypothetical protein
MADAAFALRDDETGLRLLRWPRMEQFFVGHWSYEDLFEDPDAVPSPRLEVGLGGVEVLADLDGHRDEDDGSYAVDDAVVEVLDAQGSVLGTYGLAWAVLALQPEGPGLLWGDVQLAPHHGSRAVWDRWRTDPPREKGLWAAIPAGEREGWVEAAKRRYFQAAQGRRTWPMPEGEIVLDGSRVTDLAGLFCAVGEAFNGPGGYFGSNFSALDDCLRSLDRPAGQRVRLVWEDAAVAERALVRPFADEGAPSYFAMAVGTLEANGVDIVRA